MHGHDVGEGHKSKAQAVALPRGSRVDMALWGATKVSSPLLPPSPPPPHVPIHSSLTGVFATDLLLLKLTIKR